MSKMIEPTAVWLCRFAFGAVLLFAAYSFVYDNLYRQDMRAGLKLDAISAALQWLHQ